MKELTDFQKQYFESLMAEEKEEFAKNADIIKAFKKFSLKQGLNLSDNTFKYCQNTGIIATYPYLLKSPEPY